MGEEQKETKKPAALLEWLLKKYAQREGVILDFAGFENVSREVPTGNHTNADI